MNPAKIFLSLMLVAWLVLFATSLRFTRPEFRPWELVYDHETARFAPNRSIAMTSIGDLGRESWIRARQIERDVVFTTDEWGYRNPERIATPEVVVLGDSFVVGSGLDDDETLPVQLGRRLGCGVYNFGTEEVDSPHLYLEEERFVEHPPRVLVYAPVERTAGPHRLFPRPVEEPAPSLLADLFARYQGVGEAIRRRVGVLERDNGLSRQTRFLYNGLRYPVLGYAREREFEGQWVLTLEAEELHLTEDPEGERFAGLTVRMLKRLSEVLAERGTHLVFCPIPEAGTIYPDIFPPEQREAMRTPSFLDLVLDGAEQAGVEVVDLRPVYREARSPFLYLRDDSHWSPRCVEITADALAAALRDRGLLD